MNNDLHYKNKYINMHSDSQSGSGSDSSEYSGSESESDVEAKMLKTHKDKINKVEVTNLLIINSKDRDWRGINSGIASDPDTFNYTVKFAPTSDTGDFKGQSQLAHFLTNYKDITSIEFSYILIPNIYLNLELMHSLTDTNNNIINSSNDSSIDSKNIRLPRLTDLPYICLIIDEIGKTIDGTNSVLNTSTAILVPEDIRFTSNDNSGNYSNTTVNTYEYNNLGKHILADTHPSIIKFSNIIPWRKTYLPAPKASINLLNISFVDPDGNKIKLLDNYLDIESIGLAQTSDSGKVVSLVSLDVTVDNAWQTSQTHSNVTSFTTNNNGSGFKCDLTTSSDGLTITLTINNGGSNFLESDFITITDPGSTSNTATFFVKEVTGTILSINTKTYFSSEEYKVGNKILFNNVTFTRSSYFDKNILDYSALEKKINRSSGHIIIGLDESLAGTNTSRSKMYNQIQIALEYNLDKTTGNSSIKTLYNLKKNVLGKVNSVNTTTSVSIGDTSSSDYYDLPSSTTSYYNGKTIVFTSGVNKDVSRTINTYTKDINNKLIATIDALNNACSVNDTFRINIAGNVSTGKLINLELQNTIAFKITSEITDNSIFKSLNL